MLYVTRTTPRDGLVRLRWSRPVIARLEDLVQPSARPAGVSSFEAIASVTGASVALSGGTSVPEQIDGELVSPGYFTTLRVAPSAGRTFLAEDDGVPGAPPLAIVSDRLWRRRFAADPSLVGRTVRISDVPLTVIGIAAAGISGITGKADLWMPRTMAPTLTYSDYLITPQHFISVVARLRPGVTVDQANAELAAIGSRFADATHTAGCAAGDVERDRARGAGRTCRSDAAPFGACCCSRPPAACCSSRASTSPG